MSQFAIIVWLVLSFMTVGECVTAGSAGEAGMSRKLLYVEEESMSRTVVSNTQVPDWMRQKLESSGQEHDRTSLTPETLAKAGKAMAGGLAKIPHSPSAVIAELIQTSPQTSPVQKPPSSPLPEPEVTSPSVQPETTPLEEEPEMVPAEQPASPEMDPVDSPVTSPVMVQEITPGEPEIEPQLPPTMPVESVALKQEPEAPEELEPESVEVPATASEISEAPMSTDESGVSPASTPAAASEESPKSVAGPEVSSSSLDGPEVEVPPEASQTPIIPPAASPSPAPTSARQSSIELQTSSCESEGKCKEGSPSLLPRQSVSIQSTTVSKSTDHPRQSSSLPPVQKPVAKIETDTAPEHHNSGTHMSHGVKVASWTLAGICLVLVAIGNFLGIYYSRNRRRQRSQDVSVDV